ncbi:GWxTD domain-containing protein [Ohtaekwangia koreensis]|uniref:GWxTD domain-containing protein n=1 Tax=Ohtaekwangia koreensis TaxID=688867 RepID=A0A1T5IK93_9BACT|nr:GWxTD domain-containing protein [Ohtaekwangia koreensis]SKC39581.1 GWxTD domain-containing protein [Ohtaekwangia koreensis]
MNRFVLLFVAMSSVAIGQPLRDINYNFLYDPGQPVSLEIKSVRSGTTWDIFYKLHRRDTTVTDFSIEWSTRNGLGDKEGTVVNTVTGDAVAGKVALPVSASAQVLVAKVINITAKQAWFFYRVLDPKYPVNGWLSAPDGAVTSPYVKGGSYTLHGSASTKVVSHYHDTFPAATPAFSEALGRVAPALKVDSTFTVQGDQTVTLSSQGLYLVQTDTNAAEGFAFRVQHDYPRLTKLESLADPFIYVCTRQEFDRLKIARGDKKAFDKVILGITGDADRAKKFMRSYFKRVELSNQFFTSYKEGWKTDRGMIYIVFGLPDEVYKFSDREVWSYKNSLFKATFDFVKSPTLFDPDNYVLIRERKYQETWYEVIDLWRNARF